MKKHNVFLILYFLFSPFLNAQTIPVDPLTGRPIVNIPLGGIKALDLGVSINLSHHGDALKVSEGPGNAGMGWNVNLGGYIYREVRGLPDEVNDSRKGWLQNGNAASIESFTPAADDNLSVCTDETTDWTYINSRGYLQDTEPDVYHFSAPGISGSFIYGADGLPKLVPYQDITILPGFTIKTSTGITYKFLLSESATRQALQYKYNVPYDIPVDLLKSEFLYYQTPLNVTTTWLLTAIESGVTGAVVNYSYDPDGSPVSSKFVTRILPNQPNVATTKVDTLYSVTDSYFTKFKLRVISLNNYSILIDWTNTLINRIRISESETGDAKEFQFFYKPIKGKDFLKTKPFLLKVKEINSCSAFPDYQFEYNSVLDTVDYSVAYPFGTVDIPWQKSWGQDVFGYYNGRDVNRNIPTVYFYYGESGARRFRVTPIPGATATQTLTGVRTDSSSLDVRINYLIKGTLRKISYPTGGSTTIFYQANKYIDAATGEELFGPGVRVSTISTSGGEPGYGKSFGGKDVSHNIKRTYAYETVDSGPTSGKILYPPVFAYTDGTSVYRSQTDLGPGSMIMYSRIKETITGQGFRVYLYDIPNMYPDILPFVPTSKVARSIHAACGVGLLKNGVYTFPFAPLQDMGFTRGFLNKVSEYTQTGVLTQEKTMTYSLPHTTTTVKGLKFEAIANAQGFQTFHYSTYLIPINQSRILLQEVVKNVSELTATDETSVTTGYLYNAKDMLVQSTTTNADNAILKQYYKYAQDFNFTAPSASDIPASAIFKLNANNRSSTLIEQYQTLTPIGGTAFVSGGQLSLFKDYGTYVWPYQSKHFPAGSTIVPAAVNGTTNQTFVSDGNYILDATVDYKNGLLVNQTGNNYVPSSIHYATGTSIPLANFVNCKEDQAVYEGFEVVSSHGLVPTVTNPAPAKPAGWTGQKSITLTTAFNLITPSTNLVSKGENSYRISCWVYAVQNTNITVTAKNGATTQSTLVLAYNTPNQWQYLENYIDMTAVASTFSFQVSASATVQFDDFVALPKSARVSFQTILPFTGVTSQSDDHGNSSVINYDIMGRKVNTQDRKRNMVEFQEYGYQRDGIISLQAAYSSNSFKYFQGVPVLFTANPQLACIPNVTYDWTFYNDYGIESTATGAVVNKTFTSAGSYTVMLKVSSPGYPSSTLAIDRCVYLNNTNTSLTLHVSPSSAYHQCATPTDNVKTFTAILNGFPRVNSGWKYTYSWWIQDTSGAWVDLGNGLLFDPYITSMSGNQLVFQSVNFSYQIKCKVKVEMISGATAARCSLFEPFTATSVTGITFYPNSQCQ